jgi:hypothetical protein
MHWIALARRHVTLRLAQTLEAAKLPLRTVPRKLRDPQRFPESSVHVAPSDFHRLVRAVSERNSEPEDSHRDVYSSYSRISRNRFCKRRHANGSRSS